MRISMTVLRYPISACYYRVNALKIIPLYLSLRETLHFPALVIALNQYYYILLLIYWTCVTIESETD